MDGLKKKDRRLIRRLINTLAPVEYHRAFNDFEARLGKIEGMLRGIQLQFSKLADPPRAVCDGCGITVLLPGNRTCDYKYVQDLGWTIGEKDKLMCAPCTAKLKENQTCPKEPLAP